MDRSTVNKLHRAHQGMRWLALALPVMAVGCVDPAVPEDDNAIQIGALLPYTGDMAASGVNLERALLMAEEQVNKAGGVAGRNLSVVASNAADANRGLASTQALLARPQLVSVLGPQVADLFPTVAPLVAAADLYGMLPSEMALSSDDDSGPVRWFHLAPRIETVACAMAQTIYNDLHMNLVILATDDAYNRTFAQALYDTYTAQTYMGAAPKATLHLFGAQEWGTSINLRSALPERTEVVALITFPKTGAVVIQDWVAAGRQDLWYFGPALRADVFVDNAPMGVIEGMKGFSAYIPEDSGVRFSSQFAERWAGDTPLTDAYYYYDALALSALAIEAAAYGLGGVPTSNLVRDHIIPLTRGGGTVVDWQNLANGLSLVRSGQAVHYLGASGHVDMTDQGYLQKTIETVSVWRVTDGRVQPFVKTTCLAE
jgi:ABC-type branched-subunit amino acid transport system substrate-binding protein